MTRRLIFHPFAPLVLFSGVLALLFTTYLTLGVAPSPDFEAVVAVMWSLLFATWVLADTRRRQSLPCYDFGFFCYVFMPLVVPAYCFWSRGWRGALVLVALLAVWVTPYWIAIAVWTFMYGGG
jgi:hypothetical protein